MSAIVEKHHNWMEYQSHRVYPEVWNEDDTERNTHWVAVPPEFEQDIVQNAPYIEITYDEKDTDKIVGVKILPRPEPTPQPYQPNYNDKLLLASIS